MGQFSGSAEISLMRVVGFDACPSVGTGAHESPPKPKGHADRRFYYGQSTTRLLKLFRQLLVELIVTGEQASCQQVARVKSWPAASVTCLPGCPGQLRVTVAAVASPL